MQPVQVYLTQKQHEKIKQMAKDTGLKLSEHVRRAIDLYFETEDKKHGRN